MSNAAEEFDLDNPKLPKAIEERGADVGRITLTRSGSTRTTMPRRSSGCRSSWSSCRPISRRAASAWCCCSRGATPPARAARSRPISSTSIPATTSRWRCPSRTTARARSGISSATSTGCRPPARPCSSTAPGTTAPGVEKVMGFCTPGETEAFLARGAAVRVDAGQRRHQALQVLALDRPRDAAQAVPRAAAQSAEGVEALAGRPQGAGAVGRLHRGARTPCCRRPTRAHAPWTIVRANDKRRARLGVIQTVLRRWTTRARTRRRSARSTARSSLGVDEFLKAGS